MPWRTAHCGVQGNNRLQRIPSSEYTFFRTGNENTNIFLQPHGALCVCKLSTYAAAKLTLGCEGRQPAIIDADQDVLVSLSL